MDQLYTYEILQELKKESFADNWEMIISIIVQAFVLYLTIVASIKLSKKEFMQQLEIKEKDENIVKNKITDIIRHAITKELKEIDENLMIMSSHLEASLNRISSLKRVIFNPIYIESLLKIDYFTLVKVLEQNFKGSSNVVDFVSSIQEISFFMRKINKHQDEFADKFSLIVNNLHIECIELMRVVRQSIEDKNSKAGLLKVAYENFLQKQHERDINRMNKLSNGQQVEILNNIDLIQSLSNEVLDALMPLNNFSDPIYLSVIRVTNSVNQIDFYTRGYKSDLAVCIEQIEFNVKVLKILRDYL